MEILGRQMPKSMIDLTERLGHGYASPLGRSGQNLCVCYSSLESDFMDPTKQSTPYELSSRARSFLATLERRPTVPAGEVEEIIIRSGYPCFPHWLQFQDRYAGYVERIGWDTAIWGLIQKNTDEPEIEVCEGTWYITCADLHPSYEYRLDNRGEFLGGRAESFDIHVERLSLGWEFCQRGEARVLDADELQGLVFSDHFRKQIKHHLVPEASDRYSRYYMSDTWLVVELARTEEFLDARTIDIAGAISRIGGR